MGRWAVAARNVRFYGVSGSGKLLEIHTNERREVTSSRDREWEQTHEESASQTVVSVVRGNNAVYIALSTTALQLKKIV